MKHWSRKSIWRCARACLLLFLASLALACKGSRSPGSNDAAPHLEERTIQGLYSPYYATGSMQHPRYLHQAIRLKGGLTLVTGGSDERGFNSLDSAELFDEVNNKKGELKPPSLSGFWIDTDFEGNEITMEFQRFWHTMNNLPDNRVIVLGGAANWNKARAIEKVELFDPDTRKFSTLKDAKMAHPRVRHTATLLSDGTILVVGGQVHDIFIDIQTINVSGGFGSGQASIQQNFDIFPSTDKVEVFNLHDMAFSPLTFPDTTKPSKLTSSRGRAAHAAITFAGPDNLAGTNDDLLMLVGGFQTPNAPELVPQLMTMRTGGPIPLRNVEVYDPTLHIFFQIGTAALLVPRVNDPEGTNLGLYNDRTPDDILGMGNVVFICNGDDNGGCWNTYALDEVFVATFSGLGPAQGLTFHRVQYTGVNAATGENGHSQGTEAVPAMILAGLLPPEFPTVGRTATNIVPLARNVEARPGVLVQSTWVFTGAGHAAFCLPPPCPPCIYYDGTIGSGAIFDPLYRLLPLSAFATTPPANARDLKDTRDDTQNPTGVLGTWLALDGQLPTVDRVGFGDIPFSFTGEIWAHVKANHNHAFLIAIAGEDGVIHTADDRVLFTGGAHDGNLNAGGGEASEPSSELVLSPHSQ